MAKRITKAMKIAAAEEAWGRAAMEGAEATTATEQTTPAETTTVEAVEEAKPAKAAKAAKVKPIEVVGDMESLIEAFGTVEAVLEACQTPAQQKFVELYEFGDEPGAKGARMKWAKVVVISHDIVVGQGTCKVWIMMTTPGVVSNYRNALRGKKFFQQSLPEALEAYKRLEESNAAWLENKAFKAEVKSGQAERVAKFATMNLQQPDSDNSPWRALNSLSLAELSDILVNRIVPVGGEKPALLQEFLATAAGAVGEFAADLKAAIDAKGELKAMADYREVYEAVQQTWWNDKKVVPHVNGLRLVTRKFSSGQSYGVVLFEDDVRSFVEEMDRQFEAWVSEKKQEVEKAGKQFTAPMKPGVDVKDPVYGFLAFIFFSAKREAEVLARREAERRARIKAQREAAEAARVAENAKAVAGFKVGLGAALEQKYGMKVESLADLAGLTTKPTRKPKGDRRHKRDDN